MKKEFLLYLYNQTIKVILTDIPDHGQEKLSSSYQEYLVRAYQDVSIDEKNITKAKELFARLELNKWKNKTPDQKKSILLKDEYYDKLFYISDIAYKEAKIRAEDETKRSNLTKEQIEDYLNKMKEYLTKVASYNRKLAEKYLSEATLDFMYAIGESDYKSFRIAH